MSKIRARLAVPVLIVSSLVGPGASSAQSADLQPQTVAAFDRYVKATESRMDAEVASGDRFLWPSTLPASERDERLAALRRGELVIERLTTKERGQSISIPDGLVHHWIGVVFVPGATLERTVALLQNYDRHQTIYGPQVARSELRSRNGDTFLFHLRFLMKKVITVVVDTENEGRFTRLGTDRVVSRIVSTRVAEIEEPGTSAEREKPIGHDGGYLWRLNSYWRFQERDGGTYVQCESISLTRGIPIGLGWIVGPFVTSLPRETLEFTLEKTKRALPQS